MEALPWGGSEMLWSKTAMEALKQGHQVFVSVKKWSEKHPQLQALEENGARIFYRRKKRASIFKRILRKIKSKIVSSVETNVLEKKIKAFNPTKVLISEGNYYDFINYLSLDFIKSFETFVICNSYSEHAFLDDFHREKISRYYFNLKKLFFVSKKQQEDIFEKLLYDGVNFQIIQNPVSLDKFDYVSFPVIQSLNMAMVGSLTPEWKSQDLVIKALSTHLWRNRSWQLNIYGNGSYLNYLKKLTQKLEIEDKVVFHGYEKNIAQVWKKNHILLMPSRRESMGMAVVEAQICGRPVLVTNIGGMADLVEPLVNGFKISAPALDLMTEGLELVWANQEKLELMGRKSHQQIMKTLDPSPELTLLKIIDIDNH